MKIAFFWTAWFSAEILKWLIKDKDIEVHFVVSQEDKHVWRKKILEETAVKQLAKKHDIPVFQPHSLRDESEVYSLWKDLDFFVVVAYGKIMPQALLDVPKRWCINLHGSILPKYRWASPVQESIKNCDTVTWLTTMYMSAGMDEWDILEIKEIDIDKDDTQIDIFKKFEEIWAVLIASTLKKIVSDAIQSQKQDDILATYCHKINKSDGQVLFEKQSAQDIYDTFRAYTPWPWIFSYFHKKKINIMFCSLSDEVSNESVWKCVKIWKKVWVICQDKKVLFIEKIKLEWKGTMDILDFVNGNPDFIWYDFLDV